GHRLLDEGEFDIVVASPSHPPIRMLTQHSFDLIVADVAAPKTRGVRLIELFRQHGIDVPAIVVVPDERKSRLPERLSTRNTFLCDASTLIDTVRRIVGGSNAPDVSRLLAFRNQRGEEVQLTQFSATSAKNEFGRILDLALRQGAVAITRHDSP